MCDRGRKYSGMTGKVSDIFMTQKHLERVSAFDICTVNVTRLIQGGRIGELRQERLSVFKCSLTRVSEIDKRIQFYSVCYQWKFQDSAIRLTTSSHFQRCHLSHLCLDSISILLKVNRSYVRGF